MNSFRNEREDNATGTYQDMTWWMECMKNLSLELLLKNKNLQKKNIKQYYVISFIPSPAELKYLIRYTPRAKVNAECRSTSISKQRTSKRTKR